MKFTDDLRSAIKGKQEATQATTETLAVAASNERAASAALKEQLRKDFTRAELRTLKSTLESMERDEEYERDRRY